MNWLDTLRLRFFGRKFVLTYEPDATRPEGIVCTLSGKPKSKFEENAIEWMARHVREHPDQECKVTITTWKREP